MKFIKFGHLVYDSINDFVETAKSRENIEFVDKKGKWKGRKIFGYFYWCKKDK